MARLFSNIDNKEDSTIYEYQRCIFSRKVRLFQIELKHTYIDEPVEVSRKVLGYFDSKEAAQVYVKLLMN